MRKTVLLALMTLLISTSVLLQNSATAVAVETNDISSGMAVQTAPAAPTELTVTSVSSSSISIAWNDNSSDGDGFKIERCAGANCTDFQRLANMPANVNNIQTGAWVRIRPSSTACRLTTLLALPTTQTSPPELPRAEERVTR